MIVMKIAPNTMRLSRILFSTDNERQLANSARSDQTNHHRAPLSPTPVKIDDESDPKLKYRVIQTAITANTIMNAINRAPLQRRALACGAMPRPPSMGSSDSGARARSKASRGMGTLRRLSSCRAHSSASSRCSLGSAVTMRRSSSFGNVSMLSLMSLGSSCICLSQGRRPNAWLSCGGRMSPVIQPRTPRPPSGAAGGSAASSLGRALRMMNNIHKNAFHSWRRVGICRVHHDDVLEKQIASSNDTLPHVRPIAWLGRLPHERFIYQKVGHARIGAAAQFHDRDICRAHLLQVWCAFRLENTAEMLG